MKKIDFRLDGEYIELIKLIKLLSLAESGAHAKHRVENGEVILNGSKEFRKRAKIRHGDILLVGTEQISVI
jgi:ribosome-associated protein